MNTTYKIQFATESDIEQSGAIDFIENTKKADHITIMVSDRKTLVFLTVFLPDNVLSIVKKGRLTKKFKVFVLKVIRKCLKEIDGHKVAWVRKADKQANRLVKVLGFVSQFENMGYYKYILW